MTELIRTIGGDLPAEFAGTTYAHEHLIIDTPLVAQTMPHIHLHSIDEAVAEVQTCVSVGVRTMVDAMPAASGRDPEKIARVSFMTGMRVVAATGLHTDKYYDDVHWTRSETSEELADRFVADIEQGIDRHDYLGTSVERSTVKAGIVKAGALSEELADRDLRLFEAAVLTANRTGVPILTHTEGGRGGLNQIESLISSGADPHRIALSHTDKVADPGYHRDMLETGVYLCYDQGIREPDSTFALVESMVEAGYSAHILMGTDGARRSLWSTLGGSPGLASLYLMATERFEADVVETIFVANPARYLTLRTGN